MKVCNISSIVQVGNKLLKNSYSNYVHHAACQPMASGFGLLFRLSPGLELVSGLRDQDQVECGPKNPALILRALRNVACYGISGLMLPRFEFSRRLSRLNGICFIKFYNSVFCTCKMDSVFRTPCTTVLPKSCDKLCGRGSQAPRIM